MPWRNSRGRRAPRDRKLRAKIVRRDELCTCGGCIACTEPGVECERPSDEVDHLISVAEGGDESSDNLRGMCLPCHKIKIQEEAVRGQQRRAARGKIDNGQHPGLLW